MRTRGWPLRRFRLSGIVACVALLGVSTSVNASPRVIARETAFGDFAVARAEVDLGEPNTLYIKLRSRPKREVRASWKLSCSGGEGGSGWQRGRQTDRTPFRWRIRNSFGDGSICSIRAKARLLGEGDWVQLILLETRR
jgi:hypothetical protein